MLIYSKNIILQFFILTCFDDFHKNEKENRKKRIRIDRILLLSEIGGPLVLLQVSENFIQKKFGKKM